MIAGAISGAFALAMWMLVLGAHPIPTAPMPPCATGYVVPYHDHSACVDGAP
jgi:hypothetical protein